MKHEHMLFFYLTLFTFICVFSFVSFYNSLCLLLYYFMFAVFFEVFFSLFSFCVFFICSNHERLQLRFFGRPPMRVVIYTTRNLMRTPKGQTSEQKHMGNFFSLGVRATSWVVTQFLRPTAHARRDLHDTKSNENP